MRSFWYPNIFSRYLAIWGISPFEPPDDISIAAALYSLIHGFATGFALFSPFVLFTAVVVTVWKLAL